MSKLSKSSRWRGEKVWIEEASRLDVDVFEKGRYTAKKKLFALRRVHGDIEKKYLTLDEKLEKAIDSKIKVLYCSTKKSTSFN
ncbi:hypothetical protein TNCV_4897341 [Trichonephila clavipes]|nr:hypothetical protein TNCV_4897341 [Trichonephila clavipes]